MSDSVRPHRRQPTMLCRPRDSPGKNTEVGCHCLLHCVKVKSESEVGQSLSTCSNPMDCSLLGSSIHGIFQARVLEWLAIAFSEDQDKLTLITAQKDNSYSPKVDHCHVSHVSFQITYVALTAFYMSTLRSSATFVFLLLKKRNYFYLCRIFIAAHGPCLAAAGRATLQLQCVGYLLQCLLLLQSRGSSTRASVVEARGLQGVGSVVVLHKLRCPHGMWNHPGPGIKLESPALAGRFFTTEPPRKPVFDFHLACFQDSSMLQLISVFHSDG